MLKHADKILRLVCIALGALLIFQVVRFAVHSNPLANVTIPEIPTLSSETNSVAAASGTNSPASKSSTNTTAASKGTNSPVRTNGIIAASSSDTNAATQKSSNLVSTALTSTNAVPPLVSTNKDPVIPSNPTAVAAVSTNAALSNLVQLTTNLATVALSNGFGGSNMTAALNASTNATNLAVSAKRPPTAPRPNMAMMGMPGRSGGKPLPELSPANKARVDRIYESELFGQVMRPMPASLMGIAGNMAMLRNSSGQSGLVKEGDSLGEMKLLQIGINRVLVEEKGEKKELMIFNGYGGESLLSKKESSDETTKK